MEFSLKATSWVHIPDNCDFPLENLPFGVFSTSTLDARIGVAIGRDVLDLKFLAQQDIFASLSADLTALKLSTLNQYASLGKHVHSEVRAFLQRLLSIDTDLESLLRDNPERRQKAFHGLDDVKMRLPLQIGNFTDFFAGVHHAKNCVDIVRPGQGLNVNYYHLPTAYHGRASSIVISGTSVCRPKGQYLVNGTPTFGPTRKLDFEVEFAAFVGMGNSLGDSINVQHAEDHIFGVVLLNDWSARDIQSWESPSLGPFNGKNFCTTISPWVVSLEALVHQRTPKIPPKAPLLPYLIENTPDTAFDIPLEVRLRTSDQGLDQVLTRTNTRHVIFSFAQMIAHHTAGGCPLRTGDLISTGTISGPGQEEAASFLELSRGGSRSIQLSSNDTLGESGVASRTFLEDGDELTISVGGTRAFPRIGFGQCSGKVVDRERGGR